jgi:hypothetical protein
MEVVGVISSLLSIFDVAIRSSNVIQELTSNWRFAPMSIIALSNEINDSKVVLSQACELLKRAQSMPRAERTNVAHYSRFERQVNEAQLAWKNLETVLQLLIEEDKEGRNMPSFAIKFRWLKLQKKVEKMRKILKNKRLVIMEFIVHASA